MCRTPYLSIFLTRSCAGASRFSVSLLFRLVAVREPHRWKVTDIPGPAIKHTHSPHREMRNFPATGSGSVCTEQDRWVEENLLSYVSGNLERVSVSLRRRVFYLGHLCHNSRVPQLVWWLQPECLRQRCRPCQFPCEPFSLVCRQPPSPQTHI